MLLGLLAFGCSTADPETEQAIQAVNRLSARRASEEEKQAAITVLQSAGEKGVKAIEAALSESDRENQEALVVALGKLGPPALPAMENLLAQGDATVVQQTLSALRFQKAAASPLLADALASHPEQRGTALRSLRHLGPAAGGAADEISACLFESDPALRAQAAETLQAIGPPAAAALSNLKQQLRSEQVDFVHQAIVEALLAIAGADAVELVTPYFADEKIRYAYGALIVDNVGIEAVPALLRALDNPNPRVRQQALSSLGILDPPAESVLPKLQAHLSKEADARVHSDLESLIARLERNN